MKNFLYKLYSKIRNRLYNDTKRIVASEVIKQHLKNQALSSYKNLTNTKSREIKILITLTSIKSRIRDVFLVLESIVQQTMKPDEVVLWLSEDDFDDNLLPETLIRFKKKGLTIRYCKDIGSHTKLFYAAKEYPDYLLITVDDDIIYPHDLVENLYRTYLKYPECICCNSSRKISFDSQKNILPYLKWERINTVMTPAKYFLPLGVNGVLYFPGCFDEEFFNEEKMTELCPKADDIWFRVHTLRKNFNVVTTGMYPDLTNDFISLDTSTVDALGPQNVLYGGNDKQLKSVLKYYNMEIS